MKTVVQLNKEVRARNEKKEYDSRGIGRTDLRRRQIAEERGKIREDIESADKEYRQEEKLLPEDRHSEKVVAFERAKFTLTHECTEHTFEETIIQVI